MNIADEVLDGLLVGVKSQDDLFGKNGLIKNLSGRLLERILEGELSDHLGYTKHSSEGINSGNSRNGYSKRVLKSSEGALDLNVPRDRNGEFNSSILSKNEVKTGELNKKILYFYSTGLSTRDIQEQLKEIYGIDISPTLVSNVTNEILEEVNSFRNRPLDSIYPIVWMDALVVKCREDGKVINKAVYIALGVNLRGEKEVLGLWSSKNEGSKFWLQCLTELQNRGVSDILVCCMDGLKGFPEAVNAVYPNTDIQLCIVHMIRNSLKYVSSKDRKKVCKDLKQIYKAPTEEEALKGLDLFSSTWDSEYPVISRIWRNNWDNLNTFFGFPEEIRKVLYTTNAIESVNMGIRKVIKNKRVFPSEDSMFKMIYLALENLRKKWTMPLSNWAKSLNYFVIKYEGRIDI